MNRTLKVSAVPLVLAITVGGFGLKTSGSAAVVAPSSVAMGAAMDNVRVYPNPWQMNKHTDKHVFFDHLPAAATVKIFTVSGQFVKILETADNGSASWDLTTDSGANAASGLYLYLISTDDGQETKGKLAIIR